MKKESNPRPGNKTKQDVDKAPGEERGNGEQVTTTDLKGKKVDADPEDKKDQPASPGKKNSL